MLSHMSDVCVCIQVRGAEWLNTQLREHYWSRFSTQNYFDERGVFAVVMFTGPLVCLALVQLVRRDEQSDDDKGECVEGILLSLRAWTCS